MNRFVIGLIEKYQLKISPIIKPGCRFAPSCSAYGVLAFKKHNFFYAVLKTAFRILKCTPFTKPGTVDLP
jgi:uncharacterized protein